MNFYKRIHIVLWVLIVLVVASCNLTRNVPEGEFLLKANKVSFVDNSSGLPISEVESVIRQQPNFKTLGMRLKLRTYNSVSEEKVAKKRLKKNAQLREKNLRRLERENRINDRRIKQALERDETGYVHKRVKLKDTINPKRFFREWLKYTVGEPPKLYDSVSLNVSKDQLRLFLNRKGFFDATVDSELTYSRTNEVSVEYVLDLKEPSYIDSIFLISTNRTIIGKYEKFQKDTGSEWETPFRFDSDKLAKLRKDLATFMRNDGVYGFRESYVTFEVDTIGKHKAMNVSIQLAKRYIDVDGESVRRPFAVTRVNKVYFHIADTMNYKGNFSKKYSTTLINGYLPTYDTLRYDWFEGSRADQRTAYFLYNGKLGIKPELLEYQNMLEENNYYKGKLVDESFNHLVQLDLFRSVKPELVENGDNTIDVHYYLVPSKKQVFSFEPRATNSNGFLGVSTSINYQNKNVFGGAQKLKISFLGGFESQPPVFDQNVDGQQNNDAARSFNTFEYGPQVEYEIPGLFPMKLEKLNKRQMPKTIFSAAYNKQHRDDFDRQLFQLNYSWKFFDVMRTQVFSVSVPIVGGLQYVSINPSTEFSERLEAQNDLFLLNAYSDRFIWKDLKMTYQFVNPKLKNGKITFTYAFNYDQAGLFLSALQRNKPLNDEGYKEFLGVQYAQFFRLDNEFRLNQKLLGERSLNYRLQLGAGAPYGNNGPNMPFDYSFFAGGANDNRGFRARSLGPGVYKYYLDTNRTATEIGDIRIGASFEYRFKISGIFKGALFTDAGNIWTLNEDPNRIGGQFSSDWFKQIALAGGFGLRMDLDFLILRFDLGIPLRNPALPNGAKWIFQSRDAYFQEGIDVFGEADYRRLLPKPFRPILQIGIGFPF
jgi:hypothetical protein